jgi:tetratricopeptide (TPR) repeat protein
VSIPQLIFALLLNPQLGYPRDWDLFAFTSSGYTILAVYLLVQLFRKLQLERVRYTALALGATALISTLPWIYVNATQDRSIERFGHILDQDVQRAALGHECLAYNYRRLGEKKKEVEEWKKAIQLSNKPRYIKNLGAVYVEMGEYKKAAQKLEEVLKLDSDDHLTHSDLGKLYVMMKENDKAKIHFHKAIDSEPDNPVYYENLGLFLMNSGLYDESIKIFEKALQIRPDFLPNWRNLGFAYANSGNYIEAIKYLQFYLDNTPAAEDRIQIKAMIEELKERMKGR